MDELNGQLSIDCGDSSSSQAEAAFYQEQWRQNLGLEVTINPMITKQGADNRQNGNYCLSITGWSPDYNDPMTFLDMWVTDGGNNDTRWGSEEYDALIDSATNETEDLAARQEYFYQLRRSWPTSTSSCPATGEALPTPITPIRSWAVCATPPSRPTSPMWSLPPKRACVPNTAV